MNAREFFYLVKRMREAQKHYFAHRDYTSLNESKRLEKEIDAEIKRVDAIISGQPTEGTLCFE